VASRACLRTRSTDCSTRSLPRSSSMPCRRCPIPRIAPCWQR
jgi:hypothetical protein